MKKAYLAFPTSNSRYKEMRMEIDQGKMLIPCGWWFVCSVSSAPSEHSGFDKWKWKIATLGGKEMKNIVMEEKTVQEENELKTCCYS